MRLLTVAAATATVLAIASFQTPRVLAQGHDDGAVGRPLQLDGGPSQGSDNRGIGVRSEGTEQSAGVKSEKGQSGIEKTGETNIRERSHTHIRLSSSNARRHFAFHGRHRHIFAFRLPRHRFVIHRHGRRFVAFGGTRGI
jgi:hypothetical protein